MSRTLMTLHPQHKQDQSNSALILGVHGSNTDIQLMSTAEAAAKRTNCRIVLTSRGREVRNTGDEPEGLRSCTGGSTLLFLFSQ